MGLPLVKMVLKQQLCLREVICLLYLRTEWQKWLSILEWNGRSMIETDKDESKPCSVRGAA